VAVINNGRVAAVGSPNELKQILGLTYTIEVEVLGNVGLESEWRVEMGERGYPVVRVESQRPSEDLVMIVDRVRSQGLQVGFVKVHEPSMEEVFTKVVSG
ncbi:MAG: hypothetical protein QXN72_05830, partial [Candidatus Caldarchaeum sp.]